MVEEVLPVGTAWEPGGAAAGHRPGGPAVRSDVLVAVLRVAIASHRDVRVLVAFPDREEAERLRLLGSLGFDPDVD
ncbi:hypothetical protein ACWD6R_33925 [Streptomyces sp. NPDC005151]